jgi:pimeloyl-ACP methyl ester carboxylesterase
MRQRRLACLGPHGFHELAYTEWGDPDHEHVVVCVHGLTRNGRDFDVLASRLATRCRVLCPDVAGRGHSEWLQHKADYAYPTYLADMAALVARSSARQVDWVGTSMGGLIGTFLAATPGTPIRRMVVNDVGPFIPRAALERIASYVGTDPRFADLAEAEAYLRRVHAPFGPLSDEQWHHLATHGTRPRSEGGFGLAYDPGIAEAFRGGVADVDLWPVWDRVGCEVLVVRGAESDLLDAATAQRMVEALGARARLIEFAGIGHAPAFMAADQIAAVESFLFP